MKFNRRIFVSIFWLALGVILILVGNSGRIDSYWGSLGAGFLAVSLVQFTRHIRFATNPEYRETVETEAKDERNRFLAMKAWSWAGYLYVLIAAVGSIAFQALGRKELVIFCSGSVCLILLLYWGSWLWLRKKY